MSFYKIFNSLFNHNKDSVSCISNPPIIDVSFYDNLRHGFSYKFSNKEIKSPKVSVIVPTYNRHDFAMETVRLLSNQTLKDIEFIIFDDGSIDNTYTDLLELTKNDKRFIVVRLAHAGPYVARNLGLKFARGKYIGFFDVDDYIPNDYFEKLYKEAKRNKSDIVFTVHNYIKHKIDNPKTLSQRIDVLKNGALWDKLFKKDFLDKNNLNFVLGRFCVDTLFDFECFSLTSKIKLINKPSYIYMVRPDSIGGNLSLKPKRDKDLLFICEKIFEFGIEHKFNETEMQSLKDYLKRSFGIDYKRIG